MKTKTYRNGTTTCRTYLKTVGNGWEVGFTFAGRNVFVGNFVHSAEATKWFGMMNREIRTFTARYKVGPGCPKSWYVHFVGKHLYNQYYHFVDKCSTKHTRTYKQAVTREQRKYTRMNTRWTTGEKKAFLRAA